MKWLQIHTTNVIKCVVSKIGYTLNRLSVANIKFRDFFDFRGAIVPVLFSEEAVEAIHILIQHRESLGIHKGNEYIFASG